jgi:hypothetical protein
MAGYLSFAIRSGGCRRFTMFLRSSSSEAFATEKLRTVGSPFVTGARDEIGR